MCVTTEIDKLSKNRQDNQKQTNLEQIDVQSKTETLEEDKSQNNPY